MQNFAETLTAMATEDGPLARFGAEIKRRRGLLPLSANRAAKRAGITGQWWRQIERGGNTTRTTVIRMAMVVGWDPTEAVKWAGFKEPVSDEERAVPPPDPRALIDHWWPKLTDPQRSAVAGVVSTMAEPHREDPGAEPVAPNTSDKTDDLDAVPEVTPGGVVIQRTSEANAEEESDPPRRRKS